ncbi:tetratricopeptide repeat protein [Gramella sp. BOM4]|nr:tetratricopeptide repeat protein [Christiangramia bathymodioli]
MSKLNDQKFISGPNIDELSQSTLKQRVSEISDDSLKLKSIFNITYFYYKNNDSINFRFWNDLAKTTSIKLKDSTRLAESNWDLGNFYYRNNLLDSSFIYYRQAYLDYKNLDSTFLAGRMLLNMATIQRNVKDYTGSEISTFQAIKLLDELKDNPNYNSSMYMAYNNLGITYNGLEEFDEALKYHLKALEYGKHKNSSTIEATTLNNIGVVFQNRSEYYVSLKHFNQAINKDSIFYKNPRLYAMILDNLTYSRFKLGNYKNVEKDFLRAKEIKDSIDNYNGIIYSNLHLGEFYLNANDTVKSLFYFNQAKLLAKEYLALEDLLKSLKWLIKITNQKKYLNEYISLNDSLLSEERATRNKFTRIQYETDHFIRENKSLNIEKERLVLLFSSIILLMSLIYFVVNQRIIKKKWSLEKRQQESNQEIYNLLLSQHQKINEGKNQEKRRISSELHDGILGKLFGLRLILISLNDSNDSADIKEREKYLDELNNIESEIRSLSHDLYNQTNAKQIDLINIIEDFVQKNEQLLKNGVVIEFDDTIDWEIIPKNYKINIFRIIQEAFQNSIKHSSAKKISIRFVCFSKFLRFTIKDDGVGFKESKVKQGIGLKNIKLRVRNMNGKFHLISNENGTQIFIDIPITKLDE